jgi:uncharacterized protein (DUF924 family)
MNPHDPLFLFATMLAGCDRHAGKASTPDAEDAAPPAKPLHDPMQLEATSVVDFWRAAGPDSWFAKDPAFDQRFREKFASMYEAAARGELEHWQQAPESALALLLLLDQYPRNAFRGTPRMYATDPLARKVAAAAVAAGHDEKLEPPLRLFVYLPFAHSENLADQARSVELTRSLGQSALSHAEGHRDIIQRFGRFPHRNKILGRAPRLEEERYLAEGGFAG